MPINQGPNLSRVGRNFGGQIGNFITGQDRQNVSDSVLSESIDNYARMAQAQKTLKDLNRPGDLPRAFNEQLFFNTNFEDPNSINRSLAIWNAARSGGGVDPNLFAQAGRDAQPHGGQPVEVADDSPGILSQVFDSIANSPTANRFSNWMMNDFGKSQPVQDFSNTVVDGGRNLFDTAGRAIGEAAGATEQGVREKGPMQVVKEGRDFLGDSLSAAFNKALGLFDNAGQFQGTNETITVQEAEAATGLKARINERGFIEVLTPGGWNPLRNENEQIYRGR